MAIGVGEGKVLLSGVRGKVERFLAKGTVSDPFLPTYKSGLNRYIGISLLLHLTMAVFLSFRSLQVLEPTGSPSFSIRVVSLSELGRPSGQEVEVPPRKAKPLPGKREPRVSRPLASSKPLELPKPEPQSSAELSPAVLPKPSELPEPQQELWPPLKPSPEPKDLGGPTLKAFELPNVAGPKVISAPHLSPPEMEAKRPTRIALFLAERGAERRVLRIADELAKGVDGLPLLYQPALLADLLDPTAPKVLKRGGVMELPDGTRPPFPFDVRRLGLEAERAHMKGGEGGTHRLAEELAQGQVAFLISPGDSGFAEYFEIAKRDRRPGSSSVFSGVGGQGKDGSDLSGRLAMIRSRIEQAKFYPDRARRGGLEGSTELRFRILPDGKVGEVEILHSSGSALLDEAAVETVWRAAPYPVVESWIRISISYRLTR